MFFFGIHSRIANRDYYGNYYGNNHSDYFSNYYSDYYTHKPNREYVGGDITQVWESEEAYYASMTQEAEKKREEVLHAIKNDLIVPMSVPEDVEGCQPPANASFILTRFLSAYNREAVLGDLAEQYNQKVEQLGKRRANCWFYAEVARSLWPLAKRSAAKAIKIAVMGEWIRRMIH